MLLVKHCPKQLTVDAAACRLRDLLVAAYAAAFVAITYEVPFASSTLQGRNDAGVREGGRDSNLARVSTLRLLRAHRRQHRQLTPAPGLYRCRTGCCITKGCRHRISAILMGCMQSPRSTCCLLCSMDMTVPKDPK
eukprot:1681668-Pleurochrysis_carterae.AAC.1